MKTNNNKKCFANSEADPIMRNLHNYIDGLKQKKRGRLTIIANQAIKHKKTNAKMWSIVALLTFIFGAGLFSGMTIEAKVYINNTANSVTQK